MTELYAVHGFLGRPRDWDELLKGFSFRAIDLFSDSFLGGSDTSLANAGARLNAWVCGARPRVLLGYSLGGRVAMHALAANPGVWDAAVMVSCHPGIADDDAASRTARVAQDEVWAQRFESGDWESVIADWNAQPVFSGMPEAIERDPSHFNRLFLGRGMRAWSLGLQADLRPRLSDLKIPVLWLAGGRDSRYTDLARECAALNPGFRSVIIPEAGHRVPWEQPARFLKELQKFVEGESYAGNQTRTLDQDQRL